MGAWLVAAIATVLPFAPAAGQAPPPELPDTALSYEISVEVAPAERTYSGRERILWVNEGSTPVSSVPVHLYLNAFASNASTWMEEAGSGNTLRFSEAGEDAEWGYIEPTGITQLSASGLRAEAPWEVIAPDDGNPLDRTLIAVTLPYTVQPGETLELQIAFEGRMPRPVARTGCIAQMCLFAQWFPKIAARELPGVRGADEARWAARQFHEATEFYANYADFRVTITAPDDLVIGATGQTVDSYFSGDQQVVTYAQDAVHDFAFVVGTLEEHMSSLVPEGAAHEVQIRYLTAGNGGFDLDRARTAVHGAMNVLGARVGPYPYETLTVVYPPFSGINVGGMEYPTFMTGIADDPLFTRWPFGSYLLFETVDIHEFGHQYFYGLLGTNEQMEAFMDEGFNSYWETEIHEALFGREASGGYLFGRRVDKRIFDRLNFRGAAERIREPMARQPSNLFYPGTGGSQIYPRSALTFQTAAGLFGQEAVDRVFQVYYERFKFRHPGTEDFLTVARGAAGREMEAFLREAFFAPEHPDFAVDRLSVKELKTPQGRVTGPDGPVEITKDNRDEAFALIADERARDADGKVWALITNPGWATEDSLNRGGRTWAALEPIAGALSETPEGEVDTLYESRTRLTGPAWDNLPVEVVLTFSDGVVVRDRWDGRSSWREYRFRRPAKLIRVEIDPDNRIMLDTDPVNNSRIMEPEAQLARDWTWWMVAVTNWLMGGLWSWL